MEKKDNYIRIEEVLNALSGFAGYLLRQKKILFGFTLAFALAGAGYGLFKKPMYLAKGSFILEEKTVGGGLSGLASQFGVDLGAMSGSNSGIFAGDNILDILRSKKIIKTVILSPVDNSSAYTLADLYMDMSGWRKKSPSLEQLTFAAKGNERLKDSVLQMIHENIVKNQINVDRLNKKGSIIEIQTQTGNQVFSKLFTERLLDATMAMYMNIKTSSAKENVDRLQKRADSLMLVLNKKTYQSAGQQVLDANMAFRSTAVPFELSGREKMVIFSLYTEVIKNLEVAKMALMNQTPIMQKLDTPEYPIKNITGPWWNWMLFSALAGFGIGFFLLFYNYPNAKNGRA